MSNSLHEYHGRCACSRTRVCLRSGRAAGEFEPRSDADSCEFCRRHDGVWISDPAGELWIPETNRTRLERFASARVAFHFCAACGELAYACYPDGAEARRVAVARLGLFRSLRGRTKPILSTNFDGASIEQAGERRLRNWTPVVIGA